LKALKNQEELRKKSEKEKKALQGVKFSLVLDDEEPQPSSSSRKSGSSKKDKGKAKESTTAVKSSGSSRRRENNAWDSDDEEERAIKRKRAEERYAREDAQALERERRGRGGSEGAASEPRSEEEEELDPALRAEKERLADLAERDAFAARMKDKDKDRTKKLVEDRSSKNADPARQALLQAEDPSKQMGSLRERSRQSYLGKREQQQLDLLRLELADWERDFRGVKMTKSERKEFESKKELLRLAEERLAIDDGGDGYMMPDGKRRPILIIFDVEADPRALRSS
jgi:pre-mRNA-splicing factor ATP-dependent RNA helicase DHX16